MKTCLKCRKNFPDETKFCPVCGSELADVPQEHFCAKCGSKVAAGAKFCPVCGAPAEQGQAAPAPAAKPASAAINPNPHVAAAQVSSKPSKWDEIKKDYFSFEGRLNRQPYIVRSLIIYVIMMGLFGCSYVLFGNEYGDTSVMEDLLDVIAFITFCVSNLSLCVRRLHDLGRSGWLVLVNAIPVLNAALTIYMVFFKGNEGTNQYGPDPLQNAD